MQAEKLPADLMPAAEIAERLKMGYWRLHDWYQRGIVRSWRLGRVRVLSLAEVRRELRRRETVKPVKLQPRYGAIEALPSASETPAKASSPPPLALPELPGAEWTPGGPWGYTTR